MKDKENNAIDFGEVKVPSAWNEMTLKTFQDIERYYADKDKEFNLLDVLDIIIGKDKDYIMSLPGEFLDIIMKKLEFLQTNPDMGEPSNSITVNGETYTIHTENKLKVGEYVSADMLIKDDPFNYAGILGILCRKEGEDYTSQFENEVLEDRIKMWETIPMLDAMKTVNFFLTLWLTLETPILLSSQIREGIDHTAKNIETSVKSGVLSKRTSKSLMKKLRKLEKSLDNI